MYAPTHEKSDQVWNKSNKVKDYSSQENVKLNWMEVKTSEAINNKQVKLSQQEGKSGHKHEKSMQIKSNPLTGGKN